MKHDEEETGFLATTEGKVLAGVGVAAVFILILLFMGILSSKREVVDLGNREKSQEKVVALTQDKMWKTLLQKAGITQQYPQNQKEMLAEVVQGRTGGQFAKFVTENNPQFDTSLLKDLMLSVDTERTAFLREQKKWVDLNQKRNTLLEDPFWGRFLREYKPYEVNIITSARTKEAVRTGEDNDVDLFSAKK